jgi:hypothetical protein
MQQYPHPFNQTLFRCTLLTVSTGVNNLYTLLHAFHAAQNEQHCNGFYNVYNVPTDRKFGMSFYGREHTIETGDYNATAISEKNRRFQAGNWFPD